MELKNLRENINNSEKFTFKKLLEKAMLIKTESFNLFKNTLIKGVLTMFLFIAILIPFVLIFSFITVSLTFIEQPCYDCSENLPFLITAYSIYFIFFTIIMIVATGLLSAYYKICHEENTQQKAKTNYFYFLKNQHLSKTIKLGFITSVIVVALAYTSYGLSNFETLKYVSIIPSILLVYCIIPLLFIAVVYTFNSELSVTNIIKTAFKLGRKYWWLTAFFVIVGLIINGIGSLLMGIGLLVTMPLSVVPLYCIYKDAIGFNNVNTK